MKMDENTKRKRIEAFRKAEASLYLSSKDPRGSEFYEKIKDEVINGKLTYEEAKIEVLNHHIEKSKK
ncbi:antitoxin VbhA family protein [Pseudescherichia sp.]|uniref:antitoxin VbhA family protein n=1 Tax=Pseudescherichia sp. TaxID=2055881 RepID=UPI0028AAB6AC|nr:antitoxin VbhA family protein [Pseudescherichia sp.]